MGSFSLLTLTVLVVMAILLASALVRSSGS
nr:MAG TPA: hypothetical protein [Caudoviricetes sp.]